MTWTKQQIRDARKVHLAPLLTRRGFRLRLLPEGNTLVEDHPDLIVKHHYWTWPTKNIQGNAIDFFVLVEGKSFHQAMEILAASIGAGGTRKGVQEQNMPIPVVSITQDYDHDGNNLRAERGNLTET